MNIRLIYYVNYYDGLPLAGLCYVDDTLSWFNLHGDSENEEDLNYIFYKLSLEDQDKELDIYQRFVKYVGDHCNLDNSNTGTVRPKTEWSNFYNNYDMNNRPDYTKNEKITSITIMEFLSLRS